MKVFPIYTETQRQEITAYYVAKQNVATANPFASPNPFQERLEECVADLSLLGITIEEADEWIAARRWWAKSMLVDLNAPGAPSESQCRTYHALYVASERMGHNNYVVWQAKVKRYGKQRIGGYVVSEEQQTVTKAMSDIMASRMTPEQAMALLNEYEVMDQRGIKK